MSDVSPVQSLTAFFEALSESSILIHNDAPKYTILAASPAYIVMIGITKDNLIGKGMFEAYSPNPDDPSDTGSNDVRASLEMVRLHKKPHQLPVQRYDVAGSHGLLRERYWRAINKPVFAADGEVAYIIHTAEDITDEVKAGAKEQEHQELLKAYKRIEESQAALIKSELKYRGLFESIDQGFCVLEILFDGDDTPVDYKFIETNPAFEKHTGFKDAVGKTAKQLVPDLEQHWMDLYGKVALTGGATRFTEGSEAMGRWFDVYAFRIDYTNSNIVALLFSDISERKKVEVTIQQSESNLRNTILQAPVAICIFRGPQFIVEIANDKMYELWGRGKEEVLGKSIFVGVPEVSNQGYEELLTGVYTTGNRFTANGIPVTVPRKGGIETLYINLLYEAFREADGTISGVIAVAIDVTEQVQARQKLQESQQELQLAIDAADLGTFRIDLLENKAVNSHKVNEWFGYTVQGYSREEGFNPIHPEDRDHVDQVIVSSMQSEQQSQHDVTYRVVHPTTGVIRHLRSFGKTLFNEQGKPYLIIGIIQDVTEQILHQKQLEESETLLQQKVLERTLELENLNRELKRSNKNLEEFAHAASHDMKEPIRKVLTFTERLKMSLGPRLTETEKQIFGRVENATQRMGLLVDDLLEFSHVSERPQEKQEVDLNVKVHQVITDLELLIEEKKAQISVSSLPKVKGYKRQLQQLFQNLIGNALKYCTLNQKPVINVTSQTIYGLEVADKILPEQSDQRFYLIEVRDNGIGFEPEYAERIFGMFQRLHGKAEYPGTGVGLSIARKVVENHNGYIWAESQNGKGATFKVLLPDD